MPTNAGKLSTSKERKYLVVFFLGLILLFIALTSLQTWYLFFSDIPEHRQLLNFQLKQLESRGKSAKIAFVGDSSLGNSINAADFEKLSGRPSINVALTGLFGYGGSLNMIKRAAASKSIDTVVLMHTLDMMNRNQTMEGYLYTISTVGDLYELDRHELIALGEVAGRLLWSRTSFFSSIQGLVGQTKRLQLISDYVSQTARRRRSLCLRTIHARRRD